MWEDILRELKEDIRQAHYEIKNLAPQNSDYISYYRGQLVPFIVVGDRAVYTNTNTLFNSVELKFVGGDFSSEINAVTYVDDSNVPYYDRAVLDKQLATKLIMGERNYDPTVSGGFLDPVDNRNYMYYMGAVGKVESIISKWDNREYKIKNKMEEFK